MSKNREGLSRKLTRKTYRFAFILIRSLFFLSGFAHNLGSILIPHLKKYFTLTTTRSTLETEDDFSFEKKEAMDAANEKVQEWESLMLKYQQRLGAKPGGKWMLMNKIFQL